MVQIAEIIPRMKLFLANFLICFSSWPDFCFKTESSPVTEHVCIMYFSFLSCISKGNVGCRAKSLLVNCFLSTEAVISFDFSLLSRTLTDGKKVLLFVLISTVLSEVGLIFFLHSI